MADLINRPRLADGENADALRDYAVLRRWDCLSRTRPAARIEKPLVVELVG